ncbi:host-nuclease inhibitor Gam family protein [Pseudoxanthomonas mexicana]|uniref:host-nuclease inhibitor Gam family protein n=1 Tax=Pseudoxanthomonas mexicana TaxID=128785 RepID=UPI00398A711B
MTKKSTRTKVAAIEHWVPQSRDEVNEAIAKLGRLQRERLRIETAMNDEMAEVKSKHDTEAKPLGDEITELTKGLHLWCEANRATLTQDGKVKFHEFATGVVKWRLRPPSIAIRGAEAVLQTLKKLGLQRFVRAKEEVDKEAMLKELDVAKQVGGVTVSQKEDFVVVPHESQIEAVQA